MRLNSIEITNFRSIIDPVTINEKSSSMFTFVGTNSIGKSNILRAINLFFTGEVEPGIVFDPLVDLPQGVPRPQTKISITFEFTKKDDRRMCTYLDKNYEDQFGEYRIPVALTYFANGNRQFSFTVVKGQKKNFPELIQRIQEYVSCIYIPSIKDHRTIIDSEMMRKIVGATFQGWGRGYRNAKNIGEQKAKFQNLLSEIQTILDDSGDYVSDIMTSVVPSLSGFSFSLPYENLEEFLGRLLLNFNESHLKLPVSLTNVGSGVQGFTIYSLLRLLHEIRPVNTHKNSKFLWLIEEPETFMHHDLQRKTREKLKEYSQVGHIFLTTHSPVFIDKRDYRNSFVVERNTSTVIRKITSKNVRAVIAGNLGVAFDDLFPFNRYNILVEGKSDEDLLWGLNDLFSEADGNEILSKSDTNIIVCGGASSIPIFFNVYYAFSHYADFIALFDRDKAGTKARVSLLNKGISEDFLVLIPKSPIKENASIEELVDKKIWDKCIDRLDHDGLITVKTSKGNTVDYEYHDNDRVEVKRKFSEYLLEYARRDLAYFSKYHKLLLDLKKAISNVSF